MRVCIHLFPIMLNLCHSFDTSYGGILLHCLSSSSSFLIVHVATRQIITISLSPNRAGFTAEIYFVKTGKVVCDVIFSRRS